MERAFIVAENSKFFEQHKEYMKTANIQRELVKKFMTEKGIESNQYRVTGNGSVGVPFSERYKDDIRLGIIPTATDKERFGRHLTIPKRQEVCYFKANSFITKEFAQKCVDEQTVINLWEPRLGDHFKSVGWKGHSHRYFEHDGTYYASIDCDTIDPKETPEGFTEIKLSELYKVIEGIQEQRLNSPQ